MPRVYTRSCYCGECRVCLNTIKCREYRAGIRRRGVRSLPPAQWTPLPRVELTPDHGWLAGIIDGEGCISTRQYVDRTAISDITVGMCHEESIRRCQAIAGYGSITSTMKPNRHNRIWFWRVSGYQARDIIWLVLPLLTTKRAKVEEALRVYGLEGGDAA